MTVLLKILTLVLLCQVGSPMVAHGQIWDRIKEHAQEQAQKQVAQAEDGLVELSNRTVDSALGSAGRVADRVMHGTGRVLDSLTAGIEHAIMGALGQQGSERLGAELAAGRAVLREVRFLANTDQLEPSAASELTQLAAAIARTSDTFLVEGHVERSADPPTDQSLSERRALAVKTWLINAGLPPARLVAVGVGAGRPAGSEAASERIEVARAQ